MARYVSQYAAFGVQVLGPTSQVIQGENGLPQIRQVSGGYTAKFRQQGLLPWEEEEAYARFNFRGMAEDENPIARRCSVFDTEQAAREEGWDEGTHESVIRRLDALQDQNYFRSDKPKAAKPWPSYDDADPRKIATTVTELGLDPEQVAIYERENKARPEVLQALGETVEEADEIIVTSS